MVTKNDLLTEIKKGLYSSWLLAFSTNDTPYVSMKPEYLTTILLGKHLSEYLKSKFPSENYMVRFEERTKDVATRAFPLMPMPYTPKNVYGRAKKDTGEEGSVDMTIYQQKEFIPETKIIIECKNFNKHDDLLIKDLDRNKEFMELTDKNKSNQIDFSFLTFYLHDDSSQTKEEATSFINQKKRHYEKIKNKYKTSGIDATLEMDSLVNYPTLSNANANTLDEVGRPVLETEENYHIIYGVICLERKIYQGKSTWTD